MLSGLAQRRDPRAAVVAHAAGPERDPVGQLEDGPAHGATVADRVNGSWPTGCGWLPALRIRGGIDLPSVGPDLRACRYSRRWTRNVPNRSKSLSFVRIPSIPCSRHTAAICASNIRLPCESASRAVDGSHAVNSGPRWTTSQLGEATTASIKSAACATVEGGLNTRLWVTTRVNSLTQNTGYAHRSTPSPRATSRAVAVSCHSLSTRCAQIRTFLSTAITAGRSHRRARPGR